MKLIASVLLLVFASPLAAQWLPPERQAYEKRLWESTGVEFPRGLQFYELTKVSQRLTKIVGYSPADRYGIFDANYRGDDGSKENINTMYPWAVPAGLHDSPKSQWRKVGAAYFPGNVRVFREIVKVQNSVKKPDGTFFTQPQPHLTWKFPDNTVFAELLVRVHKGKEWVFEIRMYEIKGGKMVNATTYRPDMPKAQRTVTVQPGKLADLGFGAASVSLAWANWTLNPDAGQVQLKASRETMTTDHDFAIVPRGYLGNVRTCTDCHEASGRSMGYANTALRGGGNNFSWHPFVLKSVNTDAMPTLDRRWPLED